MVEKKKVIETGIDKLLQIVIDAGKVSDKDAAKQLGKSVDTVEEWANFLEDEGLISIESKLGKNILVAKKQTHKEVKEKAEEVSADALEYDQKIEKYLKKLEEDHTEMKEIDTEFRQITDNIDKNFSALSKKLGIVTDYRKEHTEIDKRRSELENKYQEKLDVLEKRLLQEKKEYIRALADVQTGEDMLEEEQENIQKIRNQIDRMLELIKSELDRQTKKLQMNEEIILKGSARALRIKRDIQSTTEELDRVEDQVDKSKKQLEDMEEKFLDDMRRLSTKQLSRLGDGESRELIEKIELFFIQAKKIHELISMTEKEETRLKQDLGGLQNKVKAYKKVAPSTETKKMILRLEGEVEEVEKKQGILSKQLGKLRQMMKI